MKRVEKVEEEILRMKKLLIIGLTSYMALLFLVSCQQPTGAYYYGSLGADKPYVIISSTLANNQTVSMYDIEGQLIRRLYDYSSVGGLPFGLAPYGPTTFIAAVDGINEFDLIGIDGSVTKWAANPQVSGNLYDIVLAPDGYYYVIDTNQIEKFDSLGNRLPLTSPTPYINTTLGGCTLSNPTGLTINSDGKLVVVSSSNNSLLFYNLTTPPTCDHAVVFGNTPRAVVSHSNGSLYVVTSAPAQQTLWKTDKNGGSVQSLFANDTSIMSNPYGIKELPNGHLIVSSSGTASIVEFDQNGNFIKNFIKDGNTNSIYNGMLVVGGK